MVRVGLAVMGTVLVGTSVALAAPPPGSSLEERRSYYADQAIQDAGKRVERDHACRQRRYEKGPVDGAPSAALLNTIAALRRPAQPGEDVGLFPPAITYLPSIYRHYVRVIPLPDGTSLNVFPVHDVSRASPRPARCVAELRERVKQAIADRPRAFKKIARRLLRLEISEYWAPRQREGFFFLTSVGGVEVSLATFREGGALRISGLGGNGGVGTYYALVPDGIASIDFTFRRFWPTGHWSKHHPVTYRSSGKVTNNVVAFQAPASLRDGQAVDQVLRAADGHVIGVIRAF
jgi:hypothetical protein